MSKKFKGKKCVYCCAANSVTADHIFAKEFFLESRRANIPKVPACEPCNRQKSKLEHYLASVLPFGGRHGDAAVNLRSKVPKRLAKNVPLHASLHKSTKRVWSREKGLLVPTMSVPLDWQKVRQWVVFVVKGLAWHHWDVLIGPDCAVDVLALTPRGEACFQRFRAGRAATRIRQDVGAGTFSYEAAQGIDNPQVSVWEFSIYGGMSLAGDPTAPGQAVSKIGVMVSPKSIFERAEKRAMWLRGQPDGT